MTNVRVIKPALAALVAAAARGGGVRMPQPVWEVWRSARHSLPRQTPIPT